MKKLIFSLCLTFLFAGCATKAKYQVNIGNGNPQLPVQNVQVTYNDKVQEEFSIIAPSKMAGTKPRKGDIPSAVTVTWQDPKGNEHTETLEIDTVTIRPDFKGQLVLQISEENSLTLTEVPSTGKDLSTMPWAMPETWEGSVSIPGMDDI